MTSPMLPRGIQHIGVTAPDLDATTRFIVDRLGAGVVYDGLTADDEPRRGRKSSVDSAYPRARRSTRNA